MRSTALEVNLSDTKIDVDVAPEYQVLLEIVSSYVGILNRMTIFLKELSHPYRNWDFIVSEARYFSLQNFYLFKGDINGDKALTLFVDIYLNAFKSGSSLKIKTDSANNLMLFLQHICKNSENELNRFIPVIEESFLKIGSFKNDEIYFFVTSYYQADKIA